MSASPQFDNLTAEITAALPPAVLTIVQDTPAAETGAALQFPEPTGEVRHTKEYDIFKLIDSNREIDQAQVKRLVKKIQKRNLLHLRPMDVTMEYGVIDGQHRLEAARLLGVSIYYRLAPELSKADIAELNSSAKNWTSADYLNYWTVEGKEHYIALSRFLNKHPKFKLTTAKLLVGGQGSSHHDFLAGSFEVRDYAKAEQVAAFVQQIADEWGFTHAFNPRFVMAINYCLTEVADFEPAVLLRKIGLQPRELQPCVTSAKYIELLEELYNYKTQEHLRVRFR
ncbi:ParB N-terminal domain-containing protein [Hymenobacter guriensis]|uniref:ParB N-terminal domain-containing protein n=1 Tax=Hymenobacter guriensis TaxID=2793065 RepID=A0ABS0L7U2_9BACT|nr:ParB N-terminal domain-containing protein [Hymenobacter guriensis]MBG8556177.1 ParB N-terminal domain-containing protein [Hymenobacter guriensis]